MTFSPVSSNNSIFANSVANVDRRSPLPTTPERALEIITSPERPRDIGLVEWSKMSSVEQLRAQQGVSEPVVQFARAEVVGGRVDIIPESGIRSDLPTFNIPNNVGAEGFSPGLFTHDYIVTNLAPTTLTGTAGLAAIGAALRNNPTPGLDFPATGQGVRNDVGHLVPFDGGDNFVRSYIIPSTDPSRSDAIVNYTIAGEHTMAEGFVIRFGELGVDGKISLVTYGEGNAIKQSELTRGRWEPIVKDVWTQNAQQIFATAEAAVNR